MLEIEIPGYKGSSPPTGGTKWSQLDKPTTFRAAIAAKNAKYENKWSNNINYNNRNNIDTLLTA